MVDVWGGSWGTSWNSHWAESTTPPTPPITPSSTQVGGRGIGGRRRRVIDFDRADEALAQEIERAVNEPRVTRSSRVSPSPLSEPPTPTQPFVPLRPLDPSPALSPEALAALQANELIAVNLDKTVKNFTEEELLMLLILHA